MLNFSEGGVTLSAGIDGRRANGDGLYPIRIRVTFKRDSRYYPTGKYISKEGWKKLPDAKSKAFTEIKSFVQIMVERIKEIIKELLKNDNFSLDTLNVWLGKATGNTINITFRARVEDLSEKGKVSTSDWYKYTLRSIELFAGNNIEFTRVTVDWLKKYEQHLLTEGKSYTTISMYMRALQVIINEGKASGLVKASSHPFGKGKYEIPQHEGRNIALTINQISLIFNYTCETDSLAMCRDLWFFSYLCNGANITDICKLRFSNIQNGEVCFYRQKTLAKAKKKKLIQATLTFEMQVIIKRWGNQTQAPENFIFPFLKGNETPLDERRVIKNITHLINDKMKWLGERLGIGNISTYTARHSYASVLKRSGAKIAFISESLGHNDLKTTENYLASFEQEERMKNAALLINF
ncbi:site-specific integrase [Adhaeribacter rhizoryzae]|uniref:Tyrosine-type recombinase/integrase n=1 Tax=Adhaeribacter rhizoryzae TaxID=2607907 RepID=A0A5M6DLG7_9BACT|nr:site-specific integrase [Adhaeribacter rhizoryzae]KAA5548381.1 tyrosine-type recombinase/integrase [Adhaeribacter rhizoryzae]